MLLRLAIRNLIRSPVRTVIAASATIVGLLLALFATSMETGQWDTVLRASIGAAAGHVVVHAPGALEDPGPARHVTGATAVVTSIEAAVPPGAAVVPRISLGGLLTSPKNRVAIGLRGVDPAREGPFVRVDDLVDTSDGGGWLENGDVRGIVVGSGLAEKLEVGLDDKVVFMGQDSDDEIASRLFRIRGVYRTGNDFVDGFTAFATLAAAQEFLGAGDAVTQIAVQLPRSGGEAALATTLQATLGDGAEARTWKDVLPLLDEQRRLDEGFSYVIYSLLLGAVAIGIVIVVFVSVLERSREFGVLMAIGMKKQQLARMVLLEGAILGVVATTLGMLAAIGVVMAINASGGIDFGSVVDNAVPVEGVTIDPVLRPGIAPFKFAFFGTTTVLFSVIATLWPAWRVLRMQPVDAMRAV